MKAGVVILVLLLLLGCVVYVTVLHPLEKAAHETQTSSSTTMLPPSEAPTVLPKEFTSSTPIQYTYPQVMYVNNITLVYREEYGAVLASEKIDVGGLASIRLFYDPREGYLEFFVDVRNYNEFYRLLAELWNRSAAIYAEPPPNVVMTPYSLIEGPIPLGDAYDHLVSLLEKHVNVWSIDGDTVFGVHVHAVKLSSVVETDGMVLHVDLSKYTSKLKSEEAFREITVSKRFRLGAWRVYINGTEKEMEIVVRFVVPAPLTVYWSLGLHSSDIQYLVPLFWYRDPYFYKVVVPSFKFIAEFLGLNCTGKAMLIRNFSSSLDVSDENIANFGDFLLRGGSCREFAFYSMMLARELGIDNVYMLTASPKTGSGGWVIAPTVYGHALTVTDDPAIGDISHNLTFDGKRFYVFVDNGWAVSHWDKFLSMVMDGIAYLVYPNPQYVGEPSLTDIYFSMYLLSLNDWRPYSAPIAVVENNSILVVVYDEYEGRAFLESSVALGLQPRYMERFDLSIPLYNVSSSIAKLFRYELRMKHGVVKVDNPGDPHSIEIWVRCPKTIHELNVRECVNKTCTVYRYIVCACGLCFKTNNTKLCSPEPCWPEWFVYAHYRKALYPNGMYEEIQLPYSESQALYRIAVKIPLIVHKASTS